jgi:hypothetical protein
VRLQAGPSPPCAPYYCEGAGHDDVDAVDRGECERQIRKFFSRMGEESHERMYAAGLAAGGRDLAASLASRQAP